jgi:hypothetical protein
MDGKVKDIILITTKRTDKRLLNRMKYHYSKPKGFVGRSICYAVYYDRIYYGHIVGGSSTRFLPGRNEYLGITLKELNYVVNNIFFNVSPVNDKYPIRNFTTECVKKFVRTIQVDWIEKYGNDVLGFETLVELPRTGELYRKAGWIEVGRTKGFTCKRTGGRGTDSWTGKKVWNTTNLRPKIVLCYKLRIK